jgi:amino acid adenylation domain-containing protein
MKLSEPTDDFDPFAGPAIAATAASSEAQREVWTATLAGSEASLAYNESITLILQGDVDLTALRAAFDDVVARHEALRTTLSADGLTLCISSEQSAPPLPVDLSTLGESSRSAELERVLNAEVCTPFDLERGPLYRVHVLRVAAHEVRIVFTAHHIVVDGWSSAVIIKDWATFYNARRHATPPSLPVAPTFTTYTRHLLETDHAADERYWLGRFGSELPVLDLPTDRPRPPVKSCRSSRLDATIDAALLTALKKAGAQQRASLFIVLLAAFKALLFRLTEQEDLVVGVPGAGQSAPGFEHLVGHCVNMLPMRSHVAAALPFAELVAAVRGTVLDGFEHQQYTFGTLLAKLPIPRDPSRSPLVSVVFNVDRGLTSEAIGFADVTTRCLTNPRCSENFELFLNIVELPDALTLECQFNTDLFEVDTIARWLAAYERILRAIVLEPALTVGQLPVVSAQELAQLAHWNAASHAERNPQELAHELFEACAARAPDAIACELPGASLTYGALNARANQLARRLRKHGVARGARVGLCLDRSFDMLVGLIGVLKAGAAYVPLDPAYPLERLTYMASDASVAAIVTDQRSAADLPLSASTTIYLDAESDSLASESSANLDPDTHSARADSPAYVLYTSGSTGKPKGVVIAHHSLVNLLRSVATRPGMQASDVVLAVTTLAFDIAVSELLLPLSVGARIVLVSREVAADGPLLLDVIQRSGVTFIDATPTTYHLLLAAGLADAPRITAICTGEALPRDLARVLADKVATLWNGYGPTETTVWSTFSRIPKSVERVLIGRPVDNTQIHILDAQRQPTALGVAGEIYISGHGVALGYLNRPDLSAERFVPDISGDPSRRMYRTGDRGRYLPSGEIECLGRADNQVKLRGHRIELGEIESALEEHAAIRQAAVLLREVRPADKRLVAYLVLQPSAAPIDDAELRAHLEHKLPSYMLPTSYVQLTHMPLTPSGKLDRRALPAPVATQSNSTRELVAPSTTTQQLLAALWQEALNVPRISIHDDFFASGGHSLLASQILSRLRCDHGIQLPFRKLFEAPTIAQLADVIDRSLSANLPVHPLVHRADAGPAPLSLTQERLWLLEQMDPTHELAHNLPAAWRLDGEVQLPLLQRALDEIVRRHSTLRTTFKRSHTSVVQEVAPHAELTIQLVDLSEHAPTEREPAMHTLIDQYTRERFDLERGPLFRSYLFRLAGDQHVYFSVRHNIIWDGWSFDVFLHELTTLYTAYLTHVTPELPALPIAYTDYVRWQHEQSTGPAMAEQIAWWRAQLSGPLPDLTLPSDRPRPARSAHRGDNAHISLTRAEADGLSALARESGVTLFMVLIAAYNALLHRYSGQDTVLVGTPVRARNLPAVEHLIGPFVNTVLLRTLFSPDMRFVDLLARVRDTALDAFSHEDMPLERLGTRPPAVRAFFSFQDARSRPATLGSAQLSQLHVEPKAAANDLMLWTMESPHELLAFMNYNSELFDAPTIERFLCGYRSLLRAVLRDPRIRISDLPIVADADAEQLHAWGTPRPEVAPELWASVQRWAAEAPDRIAVSDGERTMRYAELSARARVLASALAEHNPHGGCWAVPPGSVHERAVALLAADLCGASLLLLDPEHPPARINAICGALPLAGVLDFDTGAPDQHLDLPLARFRVPDGLDAAPSLERSRASGDAAQHWVVRVDGVSHAHAFAVSRAALAAGASQLAQLMDIRPEQTFLSLSAVSAEHAAYELAVPLMAGATLVQPPARARIDRLPLHEKLDVVVGSASTLGPLSAREHAKLGTYLLTGDVTEPLVEPLLREGKRVYRMTAFPEANLAPFAQRITHAHEATRLGRPLYPARVAVQAPNGRPTPIGVPGALWLASQLSQRSEELLCTERRARFMADGTLDLVPDTTAYVEVCGVRVAVAEVRSQLAKHASIADARVVVSHAKLGAPRLDAYITVRPSASFTETALRDHLQTVLPAYALPHAYTEVDSQADLEQLAALEQLRARSLAANEYVAPRTASEQLLAEHWAKALHVARISTLDNFFALGGHSLLCFEVIAAIERSSGRRLHPRVMLLGTLAQAAVELDAASPVVAAAPLPSANRQSDGVTGKLLQALKGLVR